MFPRFGPWSLHIDSINSQFKSARPFPHVVIDNFFDEEFANHLLCSFPPVNDKWVRYWNPIEKKLALNDFTETPIFSKLFDYLQEPQCVNLIKQITGINNLEADPFLHGAGLHFHPKGGKLDMHLDYSIHPITKKERRINLIIYLNKDWKESYNGDVQLWDSDFTEAQSRIYPVFNRAVIFQTNDISYHGMPQMINCPYGNNIGRKSIAIYYVSEPTSTVFVRHKAHFRPLPTQPVNDKLKQLFDIRNTANITPRILSAIYPDWEYDGDGWW